MPMHHFICVIQHSKWHVGIQVLLSENFWGIFFYIFDLQLVESMGVKCADTESLLYLHFSSGIVV